MSVDMTIFYYKKYTNINQESFIFAKKVLIIAYDQTQNLKLMCNNNSK